MNQAITPYISKPAGESFYVGTNEQIDNTADARIADERQADPTKKFSDNGRDIKKAEARNELARSVAGKILRKEQDDNPVAASLAPLVNDPKTGESNKNMILFFQEIFNSLAKFMD